MHFKNIIVVLDAFLGIACTHAKWAAQKITSGNNKPRLDTSGKIIDVHDGIMFKQNGTF